MNFNLFIHEISITSVRYRIYVLHQRSIDDTVRTIYRQLTFFGIHVNTNINTRSCYRIIIDHVIIDIDISYILAFYPVTWFIRSWSSTERHVMNIKRTVRKYCRELGRSFASRKMIKLLTSLVCPSFFPARKFIGFVAQLRIAFLFVREQLVELIKQIALVSST